jgi:hypothetical protein
MPTKPYQIGKPFDIEELKKPVRPRVVSLRDQELEKAITQAAAGAASQVILLSRGVLSNRGRRSR